MEKTIVKIEASKQIKKRLRVCAYARVSRDKDTMLHSLSAQVSHYNDMINNNPEWKFKGVYADYAKTGTKEESRPEFQRMLEDCKAGEIDLIITKSISRFARNTETFLKTVRELKAKDIDIFFEEQNIHSISNDGEFMLSVLASVYQEEARSVSENMKWRIRKDFREGIIWGGGDNYGYKYDKDNKQFILVPEQAVVVKKIYEMYVDGAGMQKIANILNENGIKPFFAKGWSKNNVALILSNSNYTGDLILQKTYRKDYLTKKTKINNGELQKYLVEDNHEAIITRELFEQVQTLRKERAKRYNIKNITPKKYPFTGMIKCSCCGSSYQHKTTAYNMVWICRTFNTKGKSYCKESKQIDESKLFEAINNYFGWTEFNEDKFKKMVKKMVAKPANEIDMYLKGGKIETIRWEYRSRSESWTIEMRDNARKHAFEQNKIRGGNQRWQKSE